jgi:hypothetical protein
MNGIVGGHAYSIFHAVEVGEDIKLLLLRNPWGHGEWKGDWADSSHAWSANPAAVEAVGDKRSEEDDGSFWIEHGDFMQRFASVDFCRVSKASLGEGSRIHKLVKSDDTGETGDGDDWLVNIGEPAGHKNKGAAEGGKKKKRKKGKKH